jgi:hypothetical protein
MRQAIANRCLGAAGAILLASLAYAQATPEGHWEGKVAMGDREIGLSLDLAKSAQSSWQASMGLPTENMTGLAVDDVVVNGNSVRFTAVELAMAKFDLALSAEGSLKGTMAVPEGPSAVEFKRTGEAKVELIPPSPAVSKELEGDWQGTLQTPGEPFPVVFHFKNQPDKTVLATMDSPARNAMNVPLDSVKQTGDQVDVGIRVAHASFHGVLSKDGTELAGQFTHEGGGMPLTLKKK